MSTGVRTLLVAAAVILLGGLAWIGYDMGGYWRGMILYSPADQTATLTQQMNLALGVWTGFVIADGIFLMFLIAGYRRGKK